jgi:hypothetical protein
MNGSNVLRLMLFGWLLAATPALAESVTVRALYRPDQADFIGTDPPGRLCVDFAYFCNQAWKAFALDLPIEFSKTSYNGAANPRDQYYVAVPGSTTVRVQHDRSGDFQDITLSFVAWSQRVISQPVAYNPVNNAGPPGCPRMGRVEIVGDYAIAGWMTPGACASSGAGGNGTQVQSQVDQIETIIRVDTPTPYRMKQGMYRGTASFTVGSGGAIDLGNAASVSRGATLEVNFELEVQHALVVDFPPGSQLAVLEPPGGWSRWASTGAGGHGDGQNLPPRLYVQHPFRLWSSGPFKVYTECERNMVDRCGLRQRGGSDQVPFSVSLSLPGAVTHNGQTVRNLRLPVGQANALQFDSSTVAYNQPGALRYEVEGTAVAAMRPGETYTGWVTIVWDAEL